MKHEQSNQENNEKVSILSGNEYDHVYGLNNYLIEETSNGSNICAIYFSSSGIYYPNTREEFHKAFVEEDRFEWYETRLSCASRHIFVRDVAKQFYIIGISKRLDSIDKLIAFLREQTKNYKVITVGSSAGAYAATIAGIELEAEMIFCFSGYFNLNVLSTKVWPYIKKFSNDSSRNKWYDICELVLNYTKDIVYFYPGLNEEDTIQSSFVIRENRDNFHVYRCESESHGIPFGKLNLKKMFALTFGELMEFFRKLDDDLINDDSQSTDRILEKYDLVIILGSGKDGQSCLAKIHQSGFEGNIVFWDNDPKKAGTVLNGVLIECPRKLERTKALIVIASGKNEEAFLKQIVTEQYGAEWILMEELFCKTCLAVGDILNGYSHKNEENYN